MSDSSSGDPHETASVNGPGILAGLPRTRPQRPSARRAASRTAKPGKRPLTHASRSKPAGESVTVRKPAGESVPKQGYEPEGDSLNRPIQPPGGAELVASLAELAGELAKAGVTTGGRVLKDVFSRLPG
jgi:hypothetical protein